jgi:hypothetical protein
VDREAVQKRLEEVVARHGEWTAHNIDLGDGISTAAFGPDLYRLRCVVQLADDLTDRPLPELRVLDLLWASLDNDTSFWPTRPSLLNALQRGGFTSVLECRIPALALPRDRLIFAALRGSPTEVRALSMGGDAPRPRFPSGSDPAGSGIRAGPS